MNKILLLSAALVYSTSVWAATEPEKLQQICVSHINGKRTFQYISYDERIVLLPNLENGNLTLYQLNGDGFMAQEEGEWHDNQVCTYKGRAMQAILGYTKNLATGTSTRLARAFYY